MLTKFRKSIEGTFLSHLLRYVGIGLISGSIIHISTLGGSPAGYAALIISGIIAFIIGTSLEVSENRLTIGYITLSVLISIGVGMVSGGTQHYTDGAIYASFLIPLGLFIGYIAFIARDNMPSLNFTRVAIALACSLVIFQILNMTAHAQLFSRTPHEIEDHHTE